MINLHLLSIVVSSYLCVTAILVHNLRYLLVVLHASGSN
jgi:hypothetical protein